MMQPIRIGKRDRGRPGETVQNHRQATQYSKSKTGPLPAIAQK